MTTSNAPSRPALPGAAAATFLSTEHWCLLGTRSMAWSESFSRVSTFLNALSASVVALALVANATGFDRSFRVFALVLLPMIFFLGVTTYVRLTLINSEDVFLIAGMNRLRHAYITHVPELEPYFSTGWHDDGPGVWRTLYLDRPLTRAPRPWLHFFVTLPTVVATIDAAVAAAGAALLALHLGAGRGVIILTSIVIFAVAWAGLFSLQFRELAMFKAHGAELVRFPSEAAARGPLQ